MGSVGEDSGGEEEEDERRRKKKTRYCVQDELQEVSKEASKVAARLEDLLRAEIIKRKNLASIAAIKQFPAMPAILYRRLAYM